MDTSRRWVIRPGSGLEAVLLVSQALAAEELADQVSRAGYRVFVTGPADVSAVLAAIRCRVIVLLEDLASDERDTVLERLAEHDVPAAHVATDVAAADVVPLLAARLRGGRPNDDRPARGGPAR